MNIRHTIEGWVQCMFERRSSGIPLALFRIAICTILLVDLYELIYFRHLFFDVFPYVEPGPIRMGTFMLGWTAAVFLLLIGLKTRAAAVVNLMFVIPVLGFAGINHGQAQDMILLRASWLLLLLPVSNRLSLDRVIRRCSHASAGDDDGKVPRIVYFIFAFLLSWLYFDSGLWKLDSPMWMAGLGVWAPATLPHAILRRVPFLDYKLFMQFAGFMVILFELTFGILLMVRRLRPWLIMCGFCFHVGIAVFYPIPLFSLSTAALMIPLISSSFLKRIGRLIQRQIPAVMAEYSPSSPSHLSLRSLVASFDIRRSVQWSASRDDNSEARKSSARVTFDPADLSEVRRILDAVLATALLSRLLGLSSRLRANVRSWAERADAVPLRRPRPAPLGARFDAWVAAAVLVVLLALCSVITIGTGASPQTSFRGRLSASTMRTIYPFTGLRHHRVFSDALFDNYDYQLNLIYENDATRILFPFHDGQGFESYAISNRAWSLWWKRTEAPYITTALAERNLKRWAQFFAAKEGYDLRTGSVVIEARRQTVMLTEWRVGLLDANLAEPWFPIGSIHRTKAQDLDIRWDHLQLNETRPTPGELFAQTVHAALDHQRRGLISRKGLQAACVDGRVRDNVAGKKRLLPPS